jgi:vacuolar protein sorting-associated protein 16
MEQDEVALVKAIESGESELGTFPPLFTILTVVFIVLQQLRKKLPLAQFFRVINDKPAASLLFESWAKKHDRELLKDFYYQDDRKSASAGILIQESLEQTVRPPQNPGADA